jgi:uncharacterized protein YjdB
MKKLVMCMLSLVMIVGLISCDNWMMDSLLGKKSVKVSSIRMDSSGRAGGKVRDRLVLSVIVEPDNATNREIKWKSGDLGVAEVMSVNGETAVLYLSGVGETTITAVTAEGLSASCEIKVSETVIKATGVHLNPGSIEGGVGRTYEIEAVVEPEDATDKRVKWSSGDPVRVSVINGGISIWDVGTATITATTVDGGHTDSCEVTAISVPVTGVSLPATASGELGTQLALSAKVSPVNATNHGLVWESSNKELATVDAGGNVTFLKVGDVTITARTPDWNYSGSCVITVIEAGNLAIRFGATGTGKALVEDTFRKIHKYLEDNPGDLGPEGLTKIQMGNYIDLPPFFVSVDNSSGGQINLTPPFENNEILRLIVVGINSFNPGANNTVYEGGVSQAIPHIVMQFQHCPGTHRMNPTSTIVGGYAESEMRKYLRGENGGDITFPAGLKAAGVPLDTDIIFAPTRYVWHGYESDTVPSTKVDTIQDKLWLPTEFEMYGQNSFSNNNDQAGGEVSVNQARLAYYSDTSKRKKRNSKNAAVGYWEASPRNLDNPVYFCVVTSDSDAYWSGAAYVWGVAPAFCVR